MIIIFCLTENSERKLLPLCSISSLQCNHHATQRWQLSSLPSLSTWLWSGVMWRIWQRGWESSIGEVRSGFYSCFLLTIHHSPSYGSSYGWLAGFGQTSWLNNPLSSCFLPPMDGSPSWIIFGLFTSHFSWKNANISNLILPSCSLLPTDRPMALDLLPLPATDPNPTGCHCSDGTSVVRLHWEALAPACIECSENR